MARMHDRTKARRCAAQVLYTSSIRNIDVNTLIDESLLDCLETPLSDYALSLLRGISDHKEELDAMIGSSSENWAIDRMPLMDLNILRIALFEMNHVEDVPVSVSINEAVELAKDFGGDDNSPKFINGMLGNIARQMEGSEGDALVVVDELDAPCADDAGVDATTEGAKTAEALS